MVITNHSSVGEQGVGSLLKDCLLLSFCKIENNQIVLDQNQEVHFLIKDADGKWYEYEVEESW